MKPKLHLTALSNVIFKENDFILGEWCSQDSKDKFMPYHWDNKNKMYADFKIIDDLYEELLVIFKEILNEHHKKNYSLKSWRVLIGTWLHTIIHTIYDRYSVIDFFYKRESLKVNNNKICWYNIKYKDLIYISSHASCASLKRSDLVNQYIFQLEI